MLFTTAEAHQPDLLVSAGGDRLTLRPVRKLDQFARLGAPERTYLARLLRAKVQTVGAGIPLIEAGETPSDIHVMLSGWAIRTRRVESVDQIVAFHVPGDVCDLNAFVTRRMDSSVIAVSEIKVAAISRSALVELMRAQPRLAQAFWWESLSSSAVQREWMVRIARRSAKGRVAGLMCELAVRLFAVGLADDQGFVMPATQGEIGNACGLTPEHTNRTLRALREDGAVGFDKSLVVLRDWDRLVEIAGFDPAYLHYRQSIASDDFIDDATVLPNAR